MKKKSSLLLMFLLLVVSAVSLWGCGAKAITSISLSIEGSVYKENVEFDIGVSLSPSGASANDLVWETSNRLVATVNNGRVKTAGKGTVTITASYKKNKNIKDSVSFTVERYNEDLLLKDTAVTYDGTAKFPEVIKNAGGKNIIYFYSVWGEESYTQGTPTNAGEYKIRAYVENEIAKGISEAKLIINKKAASITILDKQKTYLEVAGGADFNIKNYFTINMNGIESKDISSITLVIEGLEGYSGAELAERITNLPAGEYKVNAQTITNNNYDISVVKGNLKVNKKEVSVTAIAKTVEYGYSSSLVLDYNVADYSTGTNLALYKNEFYGSLNILDGQTIATKNVGYYPILQGSLTSDNFIIETFTSANLQIIPKQLTITAKDVTIFADDIIDWEEQDFDYSSFGLISGHKIELPLKINDQTTPTQIVKNEGNIKIFNAQNENVTQNYSITVNPGTILSSKRTLSILLNDLIIDYVSIASFGSGNIDYFAGGAFADKFDITLDGEVLTTEVDSQNKQYVVMKNGIRFATIKTQISGLYYSESDEDIFSNYTSSFQLTFESGFSFDDYNIDTETATMKIRKIKITVSAENSVKTYGSDDETFAFSLSGALVSDANLESCIVLSRENLSQNAGTYSINTVKVKSVAEGADKDYSYYKINLIPATLTINPASISITAKTNSKIYGDDDPVFDYDVSGLKYEDTKTDVFEGILARNFGENVTISGGNTYTINLGTLRIVNSNYVFASANYFTAAEFTITTRQLKITPVSTGKVYGENDPTIYYNVESYNGTSWTSGTGTSELVNAVLSGALSRKAGENVASYTITRGTVAVRNSNYSINWAESSYNSENDEFESGTFTISKRTLTININTVVYVDTRPGSEGVDYSTTGLASFDTISKISFVLESVPSGNLTGINEISVTNTSGETTDNYNISLGVNRVAFYKPDAGVLVVTIAEKTVDYKTATPYSAGDITITGYTDLSGYDESNTKAAIVAALNAKYGSKNAGRYEISATDIIIKNTSNADMTTGFVKKVVAGILTINTIDIGTELDTVFGAAPYKTFTYLNAITFDNINVPINGETFKGTVKLKNLNESFNAGSHYVDVIFLDDSGNYNPKEYTINITINKIKIDVSGLKLKESEYVYSGTAIYPQVELEDLEDLAAFIDVTYLYKIKDTGSYSSILPKNAGEYIVQATFAVNSQFSENYEITNEHIIEFDLIINKATTAGITINSSELTYTGSGLAPTFIIYGTNNETSTLSVQYSVGGGNYGDDLPINVGEYKVKVQVETANFTGEKELDFNIVPAAAQVTITSQLSYTYNGSSVELDANRNPSGADVKTKYYKQYEPLNSQKAYTIFYAAYDRDKVVARLIYNDDSGKEYVYLDGYLYSYEENGAIHAGTYVCVAYIDTSASGENYFGVAYKKFTIKKQTLSGIVALSNPSYSYGDFTENNNAELYAFFENILYTKESDDTLKKRIIGAGSYSFQLKFLVNDAYTQVFTINNYLEGSFTIDDVETNFDYANFFNSFEPNKGAGYKIRLIVPSSGDVNEYNYDFYLYVNQILITKIEDENKDVTFNAKTNSGVSIKVSPAKGNSLDFVVKRENKTETNGKYIVVNNGIQATFNFFSNSVKTQGVDPIFAGKYYYTVEIEILNTNKYILPADITTIFEGSFFVEKASVNVSKDDSITYTYNGSGQDIKVFSIKNYGSGTDMEFIYSNTLVSGSLCVGTSYVYNGTALTGKPTNAGTYSVTYTIFSSEYLSSLTINDESYNESFSVTYNVEIAKYEITAADFEISNDNLIYTGSALYPTITKKNTIIQDFNESYKLGNETISNPTNEGTYYIIITATGTNGANFIAGTVGTFAITKKTLSSDEIETSNYSVDYTGAESISIVLSEILKTSNLTYSNLLISCTNSEGNNINLTINYNGITLNAKNADSYVLTIGITGTSNFTGSIEKTIIIKPVKLNLGEGSVLPEFAFEYGNFANTLENIQTPTVKFGSDTEEVDGIWYIAKTATANEYYALEKIADGWEIKKLTITNNSNLTSYLNTQLNTVTYLNSQSVGREAFTAVFVATNSEGNFSDNMLATDIYYEIAQAEFNPGVTVETSVNLNINIQKSEINGKFTFDDQTFTKNNTIQTYENGKVSLTKDLRFSDFGKEYAEIFYEGSIMLPVTFNGKTYKYLYNNSSPSVPEGDEGVYEIELSEDGESWKIKARTSKIDFGEDSAIFDEPNNLYLTFFSEAGSVMYRIGYRITVGSSASFEVTLPYGLFTPSNTNYEPSAIDIKFVFYKPSINIAYVTSLADSITTAEARLLTMGDFVSSEILNFISSSLKKGETTIDKFPIKANNGSGSGLVELKLLLSDSQVSSSRVLPTSFDIAYTVTAEGINLETYIDSLYEGYIYLGDVLPTIKLEEEEPEDFGDVQITYYKQNGNGTFDIFDSINEAATTGLYRVEIEEINKDANSDVEYSFSVSEYYFYIFDENAIEGKTVDYGDNITETSQLVSPLSGFTITADDSNIFNEVNKDYIFRNTLKIQIETDESNNEKYFIHDGKKFILVPTYGEYEVWTLSDGYYTSTTSSIYIKINGTSAEIYSKTGTDEYSLIDTISIVDGKFDYMDVKYTYSAATTTLSSSVQVSYNLKYGETTLVANEESNYLFKYDDFYYSLDATSVRVYFKEIKQANAKFYVDLIFSYNFVVSGVTRTITIPYKSLGVNVRLQSFVDVKELSKVYDGSAINPSFTTMTIYLEYNNLIYSYSERYEEISGFNVDTQYTNGLAPTEVGVYDLVVTFAPDGYAPFVKNYKVNIYLKTLEIVLADLTYDLSVLESGQNITISPEVYEDGVIVSSSPEVYEDGVIVSSSLTTTIQYSTDGTTFYSNIERIIVPGKYYILITAYKANCFGMATFEIVTYGTYTIENYSDMEFEYNEDSEIEALTEPVLTSSPNNNTTLSYKVNGDSFSNWAAVKNHIIDSGVGGYEIIASCESAYYNFISIEFTITISPTTIAISSNVADSNYNGNAKTINITSENFRNGNEPTLTTNYFVNRNGTWEEVLDAEIKNAGKYKVISQIIDNKNYVGYYEEEFEIFKVLPIITYSDSTSFVYNNTVVSLESPQVSSADGSLTYFANGEEKTSWTEIINALIVKGAGVYDVKISFSGSENYLPYDEIIKITVERAQISEDDITITIPSKVFDNSEISGIIVSFDGYNISATEYSILFKDADGNDISAPKYVGSYTVNIIVEGLNYYASTQKDFTITKADISSSIYINAQTSTYDGLEKPANGTVANLNGYASEFAISYQIYSGGSYSNINYVPSQFGYYKAILTINDANTTGTKEVTYNINKKELAVNYIGATSFDYNESKSYEIGQLVFNINNTQILQVVDHYLLNGETYSSFEDATANINNAGTYNIKVVFKTNANISYSTYSNGYYEFSIIINKVHAEYSVGSTAFIYSGENQQPVVTFINGTTRIEDKNGNTVANSINAGEYKLVLSVVGNNYINEEIEIPYIISKADTAAEIGNQKIQPSEGLSITVVYEKENYLLGAEYLIITYYDSTNAPLESMPTTAGKYIVKIEVVGSNYIEREFSFNFEIVSDSEPQSAVIGIQNDKVLYDGYEKGSSVEVLLNDELLDLGTDYTISFKNAVTNQIEDANNLINPAIYIATVDIATQGYQKTFDFIFIIYPNYDASVEFDLLVESYSEGFLGQTGDFYKYASAEEVESSGSGFTIYVNKISKYGFYCYASDGPYFVVVPQVSNDIEVKFTADNSSLIKNYNGTAISPEISAYTSEGEYTGVVTKTYYNAQGSVLGAAPVAAGVYEVRVKIADAQGYYSNEYSYTIIINKALSEINYGGVQYISYGYKSVINAPTLTGPSGTISYILNGEDYSNWNDIVTYVKANVGNHNIVARFAGNANYLEAYLSFNIQTKKATTTLTANGEIAASYGSVVNSTSTTFSIIDQYSNTVTGDVKYYFGGVWYTSLAEAATFIANNYVGTYNVLAVYEGSATHGASNTVQIPVTVGKGTLTQENIEIYGYENLVFNGKQQKVGARAYGIKGEDIELIPDINLKYYRFVGVSWSLVDASDVVDAGNYKVVATIDTYKYSSISKEQEFVISKLDISDKISIASLSRYFNTQSAEISATILDINGNNLFVSDYTVTYKKASEETFSGNAPKDAGKYQVKVSINSNNVNYTGSAIFDYEVLKQQVIAEVTLPSSLIYNGSAKAVSITVRSQNEQTTLYAGSDYTVTYHNVSSASVITAADIVDVGTYEVRVQIINANYFGYFAKQFAITKATPQISYGGQTEFVYNSEHSYNISEITSIHENLTYKLNGATQESWESLISQIKDANTYYIEVNFAGNNNYIALTYKFNISILVNNTSISINTPADSVYNESAKEVQIIVKDYFNNDLSNGFEIKYYKLNGINKIEIEPSTIIDAGFYMVTVYMVNPNYAGRKEVTFAILPALTVVTREETANKFVYNGNELDLGIKVFADEIIIEKQDNYSVTYNGLESLPKNAGMYLVIVKSINPNYSIYSEFYIEIEKAVGIYTFSIPENMIYDGNEKTISATISDESASLNGEAATVEYYKYGAAVSGDKVIIENESFYKVNQIINAGKYYIEASYPNYLSGGTTVIVEKSTLLLSSYLTGANSVQESVTATFGKYNLYYKLNKDANLEPLYEIGGKFQLQFEIEIEEMTYTQYYSIIINNSDVTVFTSNSYDWETKEYKNISINTEGNYNVFSVTVDNAPEVKFYFNKTNVSYTMSPHENSFSINRELYNGDYQISIAYVATLNETRNKARVQIFHNGISINGEGSAYQNIDSEIGFGDYTYEGITYTVPLIKIGYESGAEVDYMTFLANIGLLICNEDNNYKLLSFDISNILIISNANKNSLTGVYEIDENNQAFEYHSGENFNAIEESNLFGEKSIAVKVTYFNADKDLVSYIKLDSAKYYVSVVVETENYVGTINFAFQFERDY